MVASWSTLYDRTYCKSAINGAKCSRVKKRSAERKRWISSFLNRTVTKLNNVRWTECICYWYMCAQPYPILSGHKAIIFLKINLLIQIQNDRSLRYLIAIFSFRIFLFHRFRSKSGSKIAHFGVTSRCSVLLRQCSPFLLMLQIRRSKDS